jgi:pilus assembly protein CpaC
MLHTRTQYARPLAGLLLVVLLLVPALASAARQELIMRVGETKTIFLGKIKNVEVGDLTVVDVQPYPDQSKISLIALREGYTSLTVGSLTYDITVLGSIEQLRRDIENLLVDIPGVDVFTSGDRVVIDGIVKRRDDFDRVNAITTSNKDKIYSLVILDERDIVRRAQLQLNFQILEVSRSRNHNIGIDWSQGAYNLVRDTMEWVQFGLGPISTVNDQNQARIRDLDDWLKLDSGFDVRRVLDNSFFTTVSGEAVEFFRGKELIFTPNGGGLGGTVQFLVKEVGLKVTATPIVDDDGDIDLTIDIEFATVGELEFGNIPAINQQKHKAHVQLREGESFALSGFFERTKGRNLQGVPGLKDIPGLGMLFGTRAWNKGETDGIIVLTPRLLDPDRRTMRKKIKETLDIYDAADVKW